MLVHESRSGPYTAVSAGGYPTCAVKTNGGIVCWGDNGSGALQAP
ncbi:hypothetical protein [Sorangium sp. So ce124]